MKFRSLFSVFFLGLQVLCAESHATLLFETFDNPGHYFNVNDINDTGTVVGTFDGSVPFIRDRSNNYTIYNLPGYGQHGSGMGYSINNNGTIAGTYYVQELQRQLGFIITSDNKLKTVESPAVKQMYFLKISDNGVAGTYAGYDGKLHAFSGSLDGMFNEFIIPNAYTTVARSINDIGDIAGYYYDENLVQHGFVRKADSSVKTFDLPDIAGKNVLGFELYDNNSSYILGRYFASDKETHYGADGYFVMDNNFNFTELEFSLQYGYSGFNNKMQFTGMINQGYGNIYSGYIATLSEPLPEPVPEPSTLFLFGGGMAAMIGLGAIARRSK